MSRPRVSLTVAGIRARSSSRLNASMVSREEPSNISGRVVWDQVDLERSRIEERSELPSVVAGVVHACEHHVLDEHLASSELEVAPALREDFVRADSGRLRA